MMKQVAPMAGSVWKVHVKTGESVEIGQELIILESMKMEIPLASEATGVVKNVLVHEGDFVNEGDVLLEIE
ncbi:acetyl-CoA carboxylase biotin carboxyl carrier protein subunit [Priestia taiwanensis]|uniref:Biotin/lipoyl attachment protein n=1 Tax=Priestia taiwanensis TaxID=1347902 RepID=A0A917AMI1_9BACI|nr:acetyl-CoA carboxylase biotin carboxyl carrier protein subunit [Priestia taiwanensis]MBM7362312.1 acetyl-CoA carboxylase biotin carboxyl carrier protein [Priestia taiwanensis]GGE61166.1 biotin/lipoyl attachment protein [Priestia taiwanensis]